MDVHLRTVDQIFQASVRNLMMEHVYMNNRKRNSFITFIVHVLLYLSSMSFP